jgi:Cu/Ag efflux protein CusF
MRRIVSITVALLVGWATLGSVVAQTQQPPPAPSRPMTPPSAAAPEPPREVQIEGTVSKVDPLAKTLGVSTGLFGLLGATVRVADDTQIRIQGQPATLVDIKEGARVKASYEVRDGKNLAKSIEVMPEEKKQSTGKTTPSQ